jgi:predicted RNA binding protein YcfA (HicA-like mRNA interferase family)
LLLSRQIIRRLESEGWTNVRTEGSHHIFRKPGAPMIVVVPHPRRDFPKGTLRAICRQAGWEWPPQL